MKQKYSVLRCLFILSFILSITTPTKAYTFKSFCIANDVVYGLSTDPGMDGKLIVVGPSVRWTYTDVSEVTIPATLTYTDGVTREVVAIEDSCFMYSSLEKITIEAPLNRIGKYAFYECSRLQTFDYKSDDPALVAIGERAFCGCSSLESVTLPKNLGSAYFDSYRQGYQISPLMFGACYKLKSIQIPENVERIGARAFVSCTGLQSITLPEKLITIADSAFLSCNALTNITLPESLENIGKSTFQDCQSLQSIDIPDHASLDVLVFYNCKKLQNIKLPNDITTIPRGAFASCTSLSTITLPEKVDKIGKQAFYYCENLENVVFPNTLTYIDTMAFQYCKSFAQPLPNSVQHVGFMAFAGCAYQNLDISHNLTEIESGVWTGCNLQSIKVSSMNTVYDSRINCNAIIETATNTLIQGCVNTKIPRGVSKIGSCAFSGIKLLEGITIPNSVKIIDSYAFERCELPSITIPNSVEYIYDGAFGYNNFTEVTIPNSVKQVEFYVFQNCKQLKSIYIGSSVMSIGYTNFYQTEALEAIIVDPKNIWYDSRNNCNALIETDGNILIKGCKTSVIPNDIKIINNEAFNEVIGLVDVKIPNSVQEISEGAFMYCRDLKTLHIGKGVKEISDYAFIGTALETIEISAPQPPTYKTYITTEDLVIDPRNIFGWRDTFYDTCILRVPEGSAEAYRSVAPWSYFKNIEEIAGVSDIIADDNDDNLPTYYYDLQGRAVDADNLTPGIYIQRRGNVSSKIFVQ